MEISDDEAKRLAQASIRVAKYYPFINKALSEKVVDHLALVAIVSKVYGPRIAAIGIRIRIAAIGIRIRTQQNETGDATVIDIRGREFHGNKPN